MTDGETSEVIQNTDLTNQADTSRANVHFHTEPVEKATIKASKTGVEVSSESSPGTSQNKALATLYLVLAIAGVTAVAWGIGIPAAAALIAGVGTTIGIYLLVHFTPGRRNRE